VELTIDTASALASLALTEAGRPIAELSWSAGRGHAADLLPNIERVLESGRSTRGAIDAIFVNRGPGGYAGLRVGISTALALAFASDAQVLGYGRLEADAYPFLAAGRPVCAVHDAGRGEYAWALYTGDGSGLEERTAPRLSWPDDLVAALPENPLVVGEVSAALVAALQAARPEAAVISGAAALRRAATAAEFVWRRYAAGARDSHLALTPLYLREPHISQRRGQNAAAAPAAHPPT
jgi:tRNA threonylcarbamoyladenosine biosynthesis protein TsaB